MSDFPPSTDAVELAIVGDKIVLHCLICQKDLPNDVSYLNEAIVAWRDHVASKKEPPKCPLCGMRDGPYPNGDRPRSRFRASIQSGCPRCGWCY